MDNPKEVLTTEHDQIVAELKTIAVQNAETGDWVAKPETIIGEADPNVTADTTEDWNERRALVAQLETRYNNITLALEKIKKGTYGICEISGEPIEADRLAANPAARTSKIHMARERELPL